MPQLTLLFDADDTLWENNIYFERAIAAFTSFLDHREHTAAEVRAHLDRIERETIAANGYGSSSFRLSLLRCFRELRSHSPVSPTEEQQIQHFVDSIVAAEIELLPGVRAALERLHPHRLLLVTKGDDLEQRDKLDRSGLAPLFAAVEVLPEKTPAAYAALVQRHSCTPDHTWMIGNSPRSDINPALAAGLHAVFIPHADTWVLEHEPLAPAPAGQLLLHASTLNEAANRLLALAD